MPLEDNLAAKPAAAARSEGTLLVCVTCHDPHGVGTSLVGAPRSFSGVNDNGFKMLRYESAGPTLTPLCVKCHKWRERKSGERIRPFSRDGRNGRGSRNLAGVRPGKWSRNIGSDGGAGVAVEQH